MKKLNTDCFSRWHSKKQLIAIAVGVTMSLISYSAIYKPTAGNIAPNAKLEEVKKGRELYIGKCASCHALVQPEKYDAAKWDSLVNRMGKRAKLEKSEKELILKYVTKGVR